MVQSCEETNISLVKRIVDALGANDIRPLIDSLAEDVVWKSNSSSPQFRFGGLYLNRAGVLDLLAKVSSQFSFSYCRVDKIAGCSDEVWAICDIGLYHRMSKCSATGRLAFFTTVRNGKLLTYESFFDSAGLLDQVKQHLRSGGGSTSGGGPEKNFEAPLKRDAPIAI